MQTKIRKTALVVTTAILVLHTPASKGFGGGKQANKPVLRRDSLGDPLPPKAIARLGTVRFRDGGGRRHSHLCGLAFSPDGKTLVAGHYEAIRLIDIATGKERRRFVPFADGGTDSVAVSPDGKTLAVTNYHHKTLHLWDMASGKELHRFRIWGGSVAFSRDSKRVAAGSYGPRRNVYIGSIHIWDVATGNKVRQLQGHRERILDVMFSPDGRTLLSASGDKTMRLWDSGTGKLVRKFQGHEHWVRSAVFSPDGATLATGSWDDSIRLWDVDSGKEFRRILGHGDDVRTVLFSADGRTLISTSDDQTTRRWDVATGKEIGRFGPPPIRIHNMNSPLALSPDGKLLAGRGVHNNTVCLWNMETGKRLPALPGHETPVEAVAVHPDGNTVLSASSGDQAVRLWDLRAARQIGTLPGHIEGVAAMALSPSGTDLAVVSIAGRKLQLWDMATRKRKWPLTPDAPLKHEYNYTYRNDVALAYAPDGKYIAFAGPDGVVDFYERKSGRIIRHFRGRGNSICSLVISPDGRYLAAGTQREFYVWEVATGREAVIYRPKSANKSVSALVFSADSRTIAVGSPQDRTFYLWDITSGQKIARFPANKGQGDIVAFSPDGSMLVSATRDGAIHIWEFVTGRLFVRLHGHRSRVTSLAFLPDGRHLVSASEDMTLLIWNLFESTGRVNEMAADWRKLASNDSAVAFRAVADLIRQPQETVSYFEKQLNPARLSNRKRIDKLIGDLDSNVFQIRQSATLELAKLGSSIAGRLRQVLKSKLSPELHSRVTKLLKNISDPIPGGTVLRELRCVTVLENIHSPEARKLLERLAGGDSECRLTGLANSALQRLRKRDAEQAK